MKYLIALLALTSLLSPTFAQAGGPAQQRTLTWLSPDGSTLNAMNITADTSVMSSSWNDSYGTKHSVNTEQLPGESYIDCARRHSMAVHALQQVFPPAPQ